MSFVRKNTFPSYFLLTKFPLSSLVSVYLYAIKSFLPDTIIDEPPVERIHIKNFVLIPQLGRKFYLLYQDPA